MKRARIDDDAFEDFKVWDLKGRQAITTSLRIRYCED
jgi:hypothetical protein